MDLLDFSIDFMDPKGLAAGRWKGDDDLELEVFSSYFTLPKRFIEQVKINHSNLVSSLKTYFFKSVSKGRV